MPVFKSHFLAGKSVVPSLPMTDIAETIYMDAVLTPNRSLSPRAFTLMMTGFGAISFVCGLAFLSMGALPVVGFFGLDALLLYLAFRWTFRKQAETTRVTVTASALRLRHRKSNGDMNDVSVPTAFARITLDEPLTPHSWLRIEYGQKAYVIGRFLTPPERKSLADALKSAIGDARCERYSV